MEFVNSFLSYLLLMIVFVIVGGVAIFLGITLRNRSNAKAELPVTEASDTAAQD